MPLDSLLAVGGILAVFLLFMIVLGWSDLQAHSEPKPTDAQQELPSAPAPQ